jgi:hypothetical protein
MNLNPHPTIPSITRAHVPAASLARRRIAASNFYSPPFMHRPAFRSPPNRVTVMFADCAPSFEVPRGATLEEIADCVEALGMRHSQHAMAVSVQFAAAASI